MIVHCLFEQSGTFKNSFKKYGIEAYDYDILNEFGETDYVTDLLKEIENGYQGEPSLFDKISHNDLIFCFFPCIRFESQIMLAFRGQSHGMEKWDYRQKMEYDMKLLNELKYMYDLVNKMFIICIDKGLKLIMENPYSEEHFLRRYWCYSPAIIDKDRRNNGDYYKKPTQYYFLNCEPQNNLVFESVGYNAIECRDAIKTMKKEHYAKTGANNKKTARSMIHPQYADRFIRQYILDEEVWKNNN